MKSKILLFLLFGMVVSLAGMQSAQATIINFELDYEYSGATEPEGINPSLPWLTAEFDDGGNTGSVRLTMDATNLAGTQKIGAWLFNFNDDFNVPALSSLDFVFNENESSISEPTQSIGNTANTASGEYKAGPAHGFDIEFLFETGRNVFGAGSLVVYDITSDIGAPITAESFLASNFSGAGPFTTAAHVQSIGLDGEGSGWIAPNPNPVPEPATMLLVGAGLIGLAGFGRRRFKG